MVGCVGCGVSGRVCSACVVRWGLCLGGCVWCEWEDVCGCEW